MAEEEYQIPIFFINGQLDSGKTRFITETIEMGQFAEAKNKLLIVCEEGEEEYDEKMLKDNGVSMVVLEKEDLTEEKLKELDKQYDPWIVIVEYNGMWDPALLMGTAKPFGWQRGLAAILAAAVMLAAGVCGSLAAIGPRYCGEITVEQFAANFNRGASQLSTQNAGKLTRDGVWTSRDTNMFLLMNVPPFGYETDENGRLQSVCIEADGGAAFGARPTGLMQLALYAFAGAQKGHICFNRAIMDVTKRLKAQPQEAFSTVVDGVAVDYQYRAEGNWYRLTMTKTGVDK